MKDKATDTTTTGLHIRTLGTNDDITLSKNDSIPPKIKLHTLKLKRWKEMESSPYHKNTAKFKNPLSERLHIQGKEKELNKN